MFYPSTNRVAFGGWSAGWGASDGSFGLEIGVALDFAFGSKPTISGRGFIQCIVNEFQGFGLGQTAGVSVLPVDGTNSYAHARERSWWLP
jgi:hypothetical protein